MKRIVVLMLSLIFSTPLWALTDQGFDLKAVLENGTLSQADCLRYKQGAHDQETTLRCGKWLFFYDSGNRPGLPAKLIDLIRKSAPQEVGYSFENVGMVADPYSKEGLPLGMTKGGQLPGWVPTYAQSCAFCHFGKLPDGQYKVGQPNHQLDFGKITLAVALLPELALKPKKVMPEAVHQKMDPLITEFYGKDGNRLKAILQVLRLIPSAIKLKTKPLSDENLETWSLTPRGVMDVLLPPSLDDGAAVPLRILPLWGLEPQISNADASEHGAMLSSLGGTPDLDHVYYAFPFITDLLAGTNLKASYNSEDYVPLTAYIKSLTAPEKNMERDPIRTERAKALFDRSCVSCHDGADYAGTKIFDPFEIGTDSNVKKMLLDPNNSSKVLAGIAQPYEITDGVRAGRLKGLWSLTRLLHNGSVHSFQELFCLDAERQKSDVPGMSSAGHDYTCEGLSRDEKEDLIYLLNSI